MTGRVTGNSARDLLPWRPAADERAALEMWLGQAKAPDGLRLYAIGDVHGCDGLLAGAHGAIAEDLARHPAADHRIVHVGDYVDRGPDSAAAIERLARMRECDPRIVCLRGNHDELMAGFLDDPLGVGPTWLANGGGRTLADYGVAAGPFVTARDLAELAAELAARLPDHHRRFLATLDLSARFGDFFFCHAGIRPGVALDRQDPDDLLWIRDPFLLDPSDHGVVVVHGHTPAPEPEVRPNRINIDTGAVFTGRLTAIAIEGTSYRFLA